MNRKERQKIIQVLRSLLVGIVAGSMFGFAVIGQKADNVASIFDLGMGARPLAMSGAFVGLADDGNALFYNSAGLGWKEAISIISSYETRPATAGYGGVSASLPHLGLGINYFDFGDVPETDKFGNVLGTFSYRNYAIIGGLGIKMSDVPILARMPLAENIGVGLKAKFLKVSTLEPGSANGVSTDLTFLFRSERISNRVPVITGYGFGVVVESIIGFPLKYGSGHQENWPREIVVGTSLDFVDQFILAVDVTSAKSIQLGMEWSPIAALSLRGGLKKEVTWLWSLGMGLEYGNFVFDFAVVPHSYMNSQLRGSLSMKW
jgi:hypothetical protein